MKMRTTLPPLRHEKSEKTRTDSFTSFTNEMLAFGSAFTEKRREIESNQDLSDQGRAKKLAELRNTYVPALADYRRRLANIQKQNEVEVNQHRPAPYQGTGDSVLDYLLGKEIRDYLKSLPMGERVKMLTDPSIDPSGKFLHAVETSPVPDLGVNAEIIARAHHARAESFSPEGIHIAEDQAAVMETLEMNFGELRKALEITEEAVTAHRALLQAAGE